MKTLIAQPWFKRLAACLGGGFVLTLMVGSQEGTINGDFGISFFNALGLHHKTSLAWHFPMRLVWFLLGGVVLFLLLTFWRYVAPFVKAPGMLPLGVGALAVLIAQTVMNWYDPLATAGKTDARFGAVGTVVGKTPNLSGLTNDFFHDFLDLGFISLGLSWVLLIAAIVITLVAVMQRPLRPLGFLTVLIGLAGAILAYKAHRDVVKVGGGHDHALGVYVDVLAFLLIACAGFAVAMSKQETADTRAFLTRILNWRPGLVLVGVGLVFGIFAYFNDCWFGPLTRGADFSTTKTLFTGEPISSLASTYLSWLGLTLFIVGLVIAFVATYFASKIVAWLSVAVGVAGIVVTFLTLHSLAFVGSAKSPGDGQTWGNMGAGGFTALIVFALFGAAGAQVLFNRVQESVSVRDWAKELPVTAMVLKARGSAQAKTTVIVIGAIAIFYPPMLTVVWQNTLVTQIGVYVLLAIGLNVVVGWAGLLDLGYIAFYAIGSYTTAYITGSLPVKPPHWLILSPLWAIPFAIVACLIAGLLLGAPTLRLRGDYLAIVTLGFGEIITVVATNNPGGLTGGPIGPRVPSPRLRIGPIHVTWGGDNLPFWYLLLVLIVIVLVLFYRLEGSRLGRAWAAIREDEVAAQASGVNTTRVKLLAFAIGASTSGLAGVFFATQVGYFDPTLFTLQASILIVAYVVFGGMGSLYGAMAGAAVLTWLPQFLKAQVPQDDRPMWVGAAILAMMIFRPAGLLPAKRRKAELEGLDQPVVAGMMAVPASEGL